MTHSLDSWCKKYFGDRCKQVIDYRPITYLESQFIFERLMKDAYDYLYSSVVCIADACHGLRQGYYSWATCKLYYSIFYSIRGILAFRNKGLIYVESKPFLVEAVPSKKVRKLTTSEKRGGTHGAILNLFRHDIPNHILLSQPIRGTNALEWIKNRREEAIYSRSRYFEPQVPEWFVFLSRNNIRKCINLYASDKTKLYAFDPDHAVLALPILSVKCLSQEFVDSKKVDIDADDAITLADMFRDESGNICSVKDLFKLDIN